MKTKNYSKLKAKVKKKVNLNEVNESEFQYERLIEEACLESTCLERRLEIKESLKILRIFQNDNFRFNNDSMTHNAI